MRGSSARLSRAISTTLAQLRCKQAAGAYVNERGDDFHRTRKHKETARRTINQTGINETVKGTHFATYSFITIRA